MIRKLYFLLLFVFCALFRVADNAKILAIFPFPGPSQYIVVQPYLKALASRGHVLTVINAFPQKVKIDNFHDVPVMDILERYNDFLIEFSYVKRNRWQDATLIAEFFQNVTLNVLQSREVNKLLDEHFDLIIIEACRIDPLYGLAEHFKAPLIGFSSFGTDWNIDNAVGNTSPLSYNPLVTVGLTDRMTFLQRLENVALTVFEWFHYHVIFKPLMDAAYKEYFPNNKIPLDVIRRNFSLMLVNQHFSLSYPRPYVPNMIDVGGFHLNHKPAALPIDMEAFINGAKAGVIYFSMGSNIKSKDLPKETLDVLMRTFASLKQRVLWKFEDINLPGKPDNVYIRDWFPQPDVLAHPNVKLFITHGGLMSTIEAIYHGKPVLGFPVFYDQFLNIERAKQAGFGLRLDFNNINERDLKSSIALLFSDPKYSANAAERMRLYRDQPMKPLDKAIFWTEYVLRHHGAVHMRNAGQDLSFIAYHSVDTFAVLIGGIGLVIILCVLAFMKLVRKTCCTKHAGSKKSKMQ